MSDSCPQPSAWLLSQPDPDVVRGLCDATGLSPVVAGIMAARGIRTADEARAFLAPSLDAEWAVVRDIPGLGRAADRVARAVRDGEPIVVFGDFDLDGISAAAVAQLGLRSAGADVRAVVPHRFREGYGLTDASVARLVSMRPALVVTVDCGVSNAAEVAMLKSHGIDVVVTDHHEPGPELPADVAVADPKLGSDGVPLSGSGVALALVSEVVARVGAGEWRSLVDLATLGTVADVVPLVGVNRALVAEGLATARAVPRPGIAALAEVAGVALERLDAEQIAYGLAPRLNAAGRMADPALALELLTTDDPVRAEELAHALDEHNRLRQAAESDLFEAAIAEADRGLGPGDRVLVVAGEGWHEGVRGIVASRLVGRFGVPSLVFTVEGGEAKGSGRSVEGVDLHEAVSSLAPLLTRFGGHSAAVGVTLPVASLDAFREGLAQGVAKLPASAFERVVRVDSPVSLGGLSTELAAEIATLGPFGFGNPRPLLAVTGVFMNGRKRVGKRGDHLKFAAYDGSASVPAIAFRCSDIERLAGTEAVVDVAFELDVDEWRGVERVQMLVRDIRARDAEPDAAAAALVDDLFERADAILARGEYAGIGDAASFHTKLAGVTFEGRQESVAGLSAGTLLRIERQPDNPHDPCACALFDPHGHQIGYFNRRLSAVIAPLIDAGVDYDVEVTEVTGERDAGSLGVNVLVVRRGADVTADAETVELARARRATLAAETATMRDAELTRHFIGGRSLHDAQARALERLAEDRSVLAVMATGRGKSLVFHMHAAREAIARERASVFCYPLRALVADQAFHLKESLARIGIGVRTLTGETAPADRDEAFAALTDGSLDVVLTTPEFLDHHASRFAACGRVGFVVIDEAHHIGLAGANHRPVYGRLDRALEALGSPVVLAVTATAPDDVATAITGTLGISEVVLDATVRDNLEISDERGIADKNAYLASLAARGEKVIAYVNSREGSVRLARQLRSRVADLRHRCAFYNGGMTRESRHAVERAFRDGDISVVVATSAFGEGVNIPDVRHVALVHLPMGEVEFNQLCGRGGRDGLPATVHLLFGPKDVRLNRMILEAAAPSRDDLAALYLALRDLARTNGTAVEVTNAELAEIVGRKRPGSSLTDRGVSTGIGVFRELGLVESEGTGSYRRLTLLPAPDQKLDLTSSVRYTEGLDEMMAFEAFKEYVLDTPAPRLLEAFNRPILPTQSAGGGS